MKTFLLFFGWPSGAVWSNIIASVIWGAGGFMIGKSFERRSIKRHQELLHHVKKIHRRLNNEKLPRP